MEIVIGVVGFLIGVLFGAITISLCVATSIDKETEDDEQVKDISRF